MCKVPEGMIKTSRVRTIKYQGVEINQTNLPLITR